MTTLEKFIPIYLQAHYDGDALTTCLLARIMTKSGQFIGATDLDVNIEYDPAAYDPGGTGDDWGLQNHAADTGGISFSRVETAADLTVDNAELSMLPSDEMVTEAQMLAGIFDLADVRIYRVNYMDLSQGHELVFAGQLGVVKTSQGIAGVETRSLTDLLKQPEADLYSIPCSHIFGGPKCPKAYVWTEFEVTAVDIDDPLRVFGTDITPTNDFYVPGVIEWTEGDNVPKQMEVDQNTAGTFALAIPMDFAIKIGDRGRVREDCSKLWADAAHGCLYHWDTERNIYHGGFPDIPIADAGASQIPGAQLSAK